MQTDSNVAFDGMPTPFLEAEVTLTCTIQG